MLDAEASRVAEAEKVKEAEKAKEAKRKGRFQIVESDDKTREKKVSLVPEHPCLPGV